MLLLLQYLLSGKDARRPCSNWTSRWDRSTFLVSFTGKGARFIEKLVRLIGGVLRKRLRFFLLLGNVGRRSRLFLLRYYGPFIINPWIKVKTCSKIGGMHLAIWLCKSHFHPRGLWVTFSPTYFLPMLSMFHHLPDIKYNCQSCFDLYIIREELFQGSQQPILSLLYVALSHLVVCHLARVLCLWIFSNQVWVGFTRFGTATFVPSSIW